MNGTKPECCHFVKQLHKIEKLMNADSKQIVLIAGGSGLVGKKLIQMLDKTKYRIIILSRVPKINKDHEIEYAKWDPENHSISDIPKPDYIINLAGAGIADSWWTKSRKKELISSRVDSADTIKEYLKSHEIKPSSYISASAVGYYGNRGNELLTEESRAGEEFLSQCCGEWEKSAKGAGNLCSRTVILRIGIVLSLDGGALPKMLMTKQLGIYNYFGQGRQYYPWIHIDDLCRMFIECMVNPSYRGVFNAVAPQQITHKEMMKEIISDNGFKGVLLPAPSFSLRLLLGEMASVVLNSNRVSAQKVTNTGFKFNYTWVGKAVSSLLEKSGSH